MIPQFAQALGQGFTAKQIIDFFLKKFPQHKKKINSALASGYTVEQVVKFLGGGRKALNEDSEPMTEHQEVTSKDIQQRENVNKGAMSAAALAGGALAAPMATAALQHALPNSLKSSVTTATQQQSPVNLQAQQPPIVPVNNNIPQPTTPLQPQSISTNANEILTKHNAKLFTDALISSKNDSNSISGFFEKFHPKIIKAVEKEAGKSFKDVVDEYMQSVPRGTEGELSPTEQPEIKPIAKTDTVATPHGVGEVKAIKDKTALIDIDKKIYKVAVDKLIQSPIAEKDLADLHDELIAGIERETGQQVSRNVEWAGYDPKSNELAYKPHGNDKLYVYDEISPEDVEQLTSLLTQRKSTGENFIGAWEAGTKSPIGAAMYQLIKKLQSERGGKGNEYKNRYETIYDALEPAKQAAKKKHAERKKKAKKPRTS